MSIDGDALNFALADATFAGLFQALVQDEANAEDKFPYLVFEDLGETPADPVSGPLAGQPRLVYARWQMTAVAEGPKSNAESLMAAMLTKYEPALFALSAGRKLLALANELNIAQEEAGRRSQNQLKVYRGVQRWRGLVQRYLP